MQKIIYMKKYLVKKGVSWGNIFLPDSITNGFYQLRAYTNSMKNYSSEFFFTKNIYVNSATKEYSIDFYKSSKRINNSKKKKANINYKIESGNIIADLNCKVIFHLFDITNTSSNNSIYITDKKGNIITTTNNTTTNYLTFVPESNNRYFLNLKSKNYKNTKIKLPSVENNGIIIQKNISSNKIELLISSNYPKTNDSLAKTYLLLGEDNGKIYFSKYLKIDNFKKIEILKNEIPNKIINFSLINMKNEVVASIVVNNFDKKESDLKITTNYQNDTLIVYFKSKNKINGNFSISVNSKKSNSINIVQYFKLFSETPFLLRNYRNININDSTATTLLDLYYNEKYSVSKIIKQNVEVPKNKPLKSISITGEIKFLKEQIPAKYGKLALTILNSFNDEFSTVANKKGEFIFNNLNYTTDSIDFTINALSQNNSKKIIILLDKHDTAKIFFNPFITIESLQISKKNVVRNSNFKKLESKSKYNFHPSQIFSGKELEKSGYNNVLNSLNGRVPGYRSYNNNTILRNHSSFSNTEPLFLLNDIHVSADILSSIDLADVEQVEIISNPSDGLIAGKQGMNGVIAVFTKKSKHTTWGRINGSIVGISEATKFSPSKKINKYYTYNWIPNIEIANKTFTLKIPLKKQTETYISIQGISNNSPVFFTKKIN